MRRSGIASIALLAACAVALLSDSPRPDPRLKDAFRKPAQNGWVFVRLHGTPAEIGFQHGYLLAPEIKDAQQVVAALFEHDTKHGWRYFRDAARDTLWPKVDPEYQAELKGIAAGLNARGVKLDLWDVTALNAWLELVPYYVNWRDKTQVAVPERCSAFVATGSYTRDGRPVIGHNAWTGYMEGQRWNIIFDISPEHGHRILMDGYPGLIHSGDDFGMNSAGIMITETTISNFRGGFDPKGIPEFSRARKAMQYSGSIDDYARIMKEGNNGGYANNWLIADRKTGEIASLELGFKNVNLRRTRDGYFAGSNFPVNEQLIREETDFDPTDLSTSATARRIRWEQLLEENKGRIDVAAGQRFLSDHYDSFAKKEDPNERTLCGHIDLSPRGIKPWQPAWAAAGAVQAKVTSAAMAERMSLTASMGHSCGVHYPKSHIDKYPDFAWQKPFLRDMPSEPWTEFSAAKAARDYAIKPVPFTAVHFSDAFWAPRIETNRKVTIPFAFEQCERTGRLDNFVRAAAVLRGQAIENRKPPGYPFDDTDIYKVIEGASYTLSVTLDPKLDAYLDSLIEKIGAAQEKDGYLYTTRTIDPVNPHRWAGKERWVLEKVDSHELYNLGHLYEAAVAHYQATGKRSLLDIALRTAELLDRTFGPGKRSIWPGHQNTEMGLVKLYRVTGDERFLKLARFLLDARGPDGAEGSGRTYNQSHMKVVEQAEAVGHAVRATYMYTGMADVAALTGDPAYVRAMDRIWENVAGKKLYITGGIGARGSGEAFGGDYELPNMTAYNETCASIGNDYWNHRLFLLHGDAKYIDVLERTLYNGLVSGVSLDGKSFFYPNPLESNGQHARSPWFGVACCPGNITRFLASVPGYAYAQAGDSLYVNLFAAGAATIKMDSGGAVKLVQETRYPWDGAVRIAVEPDRAARFSMRVRIPGWARSEAVPSDLYRFVDELKEQPSIKVNGKTAPVKLDKGYAVLDRAWKRGDVVELSLPMPVRRVAANERVEADRGRTALQRGPIVYAAEWPDNPNGKVRNLVLARESKLAAEFRPELLNGVTVVRGKATALAYDAAGKVLKTEQEFTAIPYYAWANRGRGQMIVWIPASDAAARPLPWPTLAIKARVTTSGRKNPEPIHDGEEPRSSGDYDSFFDWWPRKGTTEWVEYAFDAPATVSSTEVYWFDDTGRGECRIPASWRVLYKEGDTWKPVDAGAYPVAKDSFNRATFKPVTTTGLRLEVTLQQGWSAGIQEWKVGAA